MEETELVDRTPSTARGTTRYPMVMAGHAPVKNISAGQLLPLTSDLIQLPTNAETDGRALAAIESVSERSTPEQRAWATGIKMMLGMGTSAVVVIVLAIAGLDVVTLAIIEVVGCIIAFVIALWLDQRDSPLATERHKATEYSKIRRDEISSQERMFNRRMDTLERIVGGVLHANSRANSQHE